MQGFVGLNVTTGDIMPVRNEIKRSIMPSQHARAYRQID
jgi:hypothetical protein